jgi:ribonuclease VapC
MFIDASVIVAILGREPGAEEIEKRLAVTAGPFFISPLVRFEASVSLARLKAGKEMKPSPEMVGASRRAVEAFVEGLDAEEMAISSEIGDLALETAMRYGKVVGHPADLNFGDCFAYACARAGRLPLLYKGNDFAETDLA